MLERERLESKKISKINAVTSMIPYKLSQDAVHVGPSDHVPLNVEVKLEVLDSPHSAGVMIDAVRCAKITLDRKMSGPIVVTSSSRRRRSSSARISAVRKWKHLLRVRRSRTVKIRDQKQEGVSFDGRAFSLIISQSQ